MQKDIFRYIIHQKQIGYRSRLEVEDLFVSVSQMRRFAAYDLSANFIQFYARKLLLNSSLTIAILLKIFSIKVWVYICLGRESLGQFFRGQKV